MLRVVMKEFDGDDGTYKVNDIVEVSTWRNRAMLEQQGYIGLTDAKAPTSKPKKKAKKAVENPSAPKQPARAHRSALASRPRVFRTG